MEQKMKIQLHLQNLREECVKEYLQGKLQTIAGKEVIHDIIHAFLEANNEEFLANIVDSILQVKGQNKRLRDDIDQTQTKMEELKDMHNKKLIEEKTKIVKQCQDKNNFLIQEMSKEKQSFQTDLLKKHQQYNKRIEQLQNDIAEERLKLKLQKQRLTSSLTQLQEKYGCLQLSQTKTLEQFKRLQYSHQQYKSSQEEIMIRIDQKRAKEQELYELDMQKQHKLIKIKEQQFQHILKQNIENDQLKFADKLKQVDKIVALCKAEKDKLKEQHDCLQVQYCIVCEKLQQFRKQVKQFQVKSKKLQQAVVESQKRVQLDKTSLGYLREENNYLRQQIEVFNNRYYQLQTEKTKLTKEYELLKDQTSAVKVTILNQNKQKQERLTLQIEELVSNNQRLEREIWRYNSQIQIHKETIEKLQKQSNKLRQSLEETREEMKTFASYGTIHQEEVSNYEREIKKIKEEFRAEINMNKTTSQLNSLKINDQLVLEKKQNKRLHGMIKKKQDEIDLWKEKQKYYEIYLQEIAVLKNELQKYNIMKNTYLYNPNLSKLQKVNKKTRIYKRLSSICQKVRALREQNIERRETLSIQIQQFRRFFNQAILLLVSKVKQQSLLCSYCQHQNLAKTAILPHYKAPSFEKTLPLILDNYGSVKHNIRTVQQKYHMISQQSRNFSSHIDELIKR